MEEKEIKPEEARGRRQFVEIRRMRTPEQLKQFSQKQWRLMQLEAFVPCHMWSRFCICLAQKQKLHLCLDWSERIMILIKWYTNGKSSKKRRLWVSTFVQIRDAPKMPRWRLLQGGDAAISFVQVWKTQGWVCRPNFFNLRSKSPASLSHNYNSLLTSER